MAFGTHWEWRGFGDVSDPFTDRYGRLNYQYGPQELQDIYIWIPESDLNLKVRAGAGGGLKFKRLIGKDGRLEQWSEEPADLFDFPLQEPAWQALAGELAKANLALGSYPEHPPGREQLLATLEKAGCKTIPVSKQRGGRWWQGPNGRVLVEWTAIHKPQPILTISLESQDTAVEDDRLTDEQAKADILAARAALRLDSRPLQIMNYMDALSIWAQGAMINT
jgi:hypothetical protein